MDQNGVSKLRYLKFILELTNNGMISVANKWFRLGGQEFKYPCGLKPDELHETPH